MSVTDSKISKTAAVGRETIKLGASAVGDSVADGRIDSFVPGYDFEIVDVQHFAGAVTAAASYDVEIDDATALAADEVPVAATREAAVLATALSARQGSATSPISLHVTTDGSGVFTDLRVYVTIRPRHMHGDPPKHL